MQHSDWILTHLVRNAFLVEGDYRVIKTSACECHTGNPAPSLTPLLNRVLVRRGEDDDKQSRFQQARFLGFIGSSNEVIALSPYGVQRHHGEWRLSPLDDSESDLHEMKTALAQMAKCDWRTPVCKTCQSAQDHKGWHSVECRAGVLPTTVPNTMCSVTATRGLLNAGPDDARVDHESKRQKSARTPAQQESSSISGIKRSTTDVEALRRADAEAEKAMKRARILNEHLQHRWLSRRSLR